MHRLSWLIDNMKEGEIARADYPEDEHWYITKLYGILWYCDENGKIADYTTDDVIIVPLTFSNMNADYEIIGQRK